MSEQTIRRQVGQIGHRQGRDVARQWALSRGWSVKWGKDGMKVTPLV